MIQSGPFRSDPDGLFQWQCHRISQGNFGKEGHAKGHAEGHSSHPTVQNIPIACTLTGVKHLHHKAQGFDIGIYFEANGHGTVLFSDRASETFKMSSEDEGLSDAARSAGRQLWALAQLINQTVGDSISDLLMVEVILLLRGVSEEAASAWQGREGGSSCY